MKEYSVKDIAELLSVSKPTIQRAIKAAAIEADRVEGQTQLYSYEKAATIITKVRPGFDLSACAATPPNEAEHTETPPQKPQNVAEQNRNTDTAAATPPQESELKLLRDMFDALTVQLAEKDKQIAAYQEQIATQNKQIQDYSDRLREAMQLTQGQQYIAAADKTANLLAAKNSTASFSEDITGEDITPEEPKQEPKESNFFMRMLKRISGKGNRKE